MNFRDSAENSDVGSNTHTEELAIKAGLYISISKAFVYRCYKKWRYGQEERTIEAQKKKSIVVEIRGWFEVDRRGSYKHRFLLHEEDLKMKFIKWMRRNLQMLSNDLNWSYINNTLLKEVKEETVLANGISLPISRQTAWNWMNKCGTGRTDTKEDLL